MLDSTVCPLQEEETGFSSPYGRSENRPHGV